MRNGQSAVLSCLPQTTVRTLQEGRLKTVRLGMKYYIINCYAGYVVQPFLVVVERITINYGPRMRLSFHLLGPF